MRCGVELNWLCELERNIGKRGNSFVNGCDGWMSFWNENTAFAWISSLCCQSAARSSINEINGKGNHEISKVFGKSKSDIVKILNSRKSNGLLRVFVLSTTKLLVFRGKSPTIRKISYLEIGSAGLVFFLFAFLSRSALPQLLGRLKFALECYTRISRAMPETYRGLFIAHLRQTNVIESAFFLLAYPSCKISLEILLFSLPQFKFVCVYLQIHPRCKKTWFKIEKWVSKTRFYFFAKKIEKFGLV